MTQRRIGRRGAALAALVVLALGAGCTRDDASGGAAVERWAKGPVPVARGREPAADIGARIAAARRAVGGGAAAVAADGISSAATLADTGALVRTVEDAKPATEGPWRWRRVEVSEAHALAAINGTMTLALPDGERVDIDYATHDEHDNGDWSWVGQVRGLPGALGTAVVTYGVDAVFARIPDPRDGSPIQIAMRDGAAWIGTTTNAALAAATPRGHADYRVPDLEADAPLQEAAALARERDVTAAYGAGKPAVDLVMGYSAGFRTLHGGTNTGAVTRLNHLVDLTNGALRNSQVNARVRLLHAMYVAYPDNASNNTALDDLTGLGGHTVPPSLTELRNVIRQQMGADLVALMRAYRNDHTAGCGLAWVNGSGQQPITSANAAYGFSVNADGYDQGWGCDSLVLPHELGHNMGLKHDRANALDEDGNLTYGAYAYAFGYKTTQPDGTGFADIMAYADSGQPTVLGFSNPNLVYMDVPFGTANDDASRALRQTVGPVGTFRPTRIANIVRARNDIDRNGRSDVVFFDPAASRWAYWKMNGHQVVANPPARPYGAGNQLVASGDFNNDGYLDHVWMLPSRRLWIWHGNGTTMAARALDVGPLAANWRIVGAADINGDGRARLLFVNDATRRFTFWTLNGTSVHYGPQLEFQAGDRLVATGDFNADGQQDLVWKDSAGRIWIWWTNTYPINATRLPAISGHGWHVLGAGDIDGDGADDLMFYHPTSYEFAWWKMSGNGFVNSNPRASVGPNFKFAASGDFNGDGRTDVLWRHGTQLRLWSNIANAGAGGAQNLTYPLATKWRIYNGLGGG